MSRSKLRENIFKLLFLRTFNKEDEMPEQLNLFFKGIEELSEKDEKYMQEKFQKILSCIKEIDEMLNQHSSGWKTSRMSKVDLAILRLAVYEIRLDDDVPTSVAINEAVELAKRFGGDDSSAFINGILGAVVA